MIQKLRHSQFILNSWNSAEKQLKLLAETIFQNNSIRPFTGNLPIWEGVSPFFDNLYICSLTSSDVSFNH